MTFTVAGHEFELDRAQVESALGPHLPDPVLEHYVVVAGRRFPPKQVLATVTGLDRADFTTHQARRILMRLGFVAARAGREADAHGAADGGSRSRQDRQAAALEPYRGKWVALGEPTEVLVAADDPREVLAWLSRHGRRSSGMFRVPIDLPDAQGAAPA